MRKTLLCFLLCLAMAIAPPGIGASAADGPGQGNMDGDGGGMGDGTELDTWTPGNDGVRITVIEKKTKKAVGSSFDWTNSPPPSNVISFVRRNKLQYIAGSSLVPNVSAYDKLIPSVPLPSVISSSGSSNIEAVKEYFTDEGRIRAIAKDAKINYDTLISGKFTVIIEPVAYFRFNGLNYAMTATEAALYDRMMGGQLKAKMGFLTHQNLPLAMFLENGELGITAWSGGSGVISNDNIIRYLGIGTVNFTEGTEEIETGGAPTTGTGSPYDPDDYDYIFEYRADTEVITAILVESDVEIDPDDPGEAEFRLPSGDITKEYVMPEDESQLVWVKWRTPDVNTETEYEVPVEISPSDETVKILMKITPITEDTPPNPEGRDRDDTFSLKPHPADEAPGTLKWGEWYAEWEADWKRVSDSCGSSCPDDCTTSHKRWEDQGEWEFDWKEYIAKITVTAKAEPDERVPTASGGSMKSGYGINAEVKVTMTTDGGAGNTTEVQHVIATFPEFEYTTYNRWLIPEGGSVGYIKTWGFKPNEYSQFKNPVHFTPIYYPDATKYPVTFTVLDAWTPAGQLYCVLTADDITVNGSVYDDWHIAPGFR